MMAVSVLSITLLTFAIASLALGLGAAFPQYETENAAQIPTSFGGLVFMMASVVLIGAVVLFEARPVFIYLSAQSLGTPIDRTEIMFAAEAGEPQRDRVTSATYAASVLPQRSQKRAPCSVTGAPHAPHVPGRYRPQVEQ